MIDRIIHQGRISALVEQTVHLASGETKVFEFSERPPGVRVLIECDREFLLTREWRSELQREDLRLPGGKVFDTFSEYALCRGDDTRLAHFARLAAAKELIEETYLEIAESDLRLQQVSECGATVRWRLYFFEASIARRPELPHEIKTAEGEVTKPVWVSPVELLSACLDGRFQETRTAGVLLRWLGSRFPELFNLKTSNDLPRL